MGPPPGGPVALPRPGRASVWVPRPTSPPWPPSRQGILDGLTDDGCGPVRPLVTEAQLSTDEYPHGYGILDRSPRPTAALGMLPGTVIGYAV
jgi:hypothetical protein